MDYRCKLFVQFALMLFWLVPVHAAVDPVRIMNYNLLNYPNTSVTADTTLRNPEFRTIMAAVAPDILVTQEMVSQNGVNIFLTRVLNSAMSGYAAATFTDGPDTDNALFYKTSKFEFISNTVIATNLRNINEFKLRHLLSGDTIRIYAVHLKASNMASDEAQRSREVDSLRKYTNLLPAGSNFIVCGDFNIYNSNEAAYIKLKQVTPGVNGHVIDAVNMTGSWNQSVYASHHTQSPRVRSFGGGVTGGMDDRFDMILYSSALATAGGADYVSGSLVAYGNDGQHYNDSINRMPNSAVSAAIANALHNASDHIPVYVTINFNYTSPVAEDVGIITVNAPSSVMCRTSSSQVSVTLKNFSANAIDFGLNPVTITARCRQPDNTVVTVTGSVNTGTLAGAGSMNYIFNTPFSFNAGGVYEMTCYTALNADINRLNDTLHFSLTTYPLADPVTTPAGNVVVCAGNSLNIYSSSSVSYLWSTSSSDSVIAVTASGNYSVTITDENGCTASSAPVSVTVSSGTVSQQVLFTETNGIPSGTTSVVIYENNNGFDNDVFTMSGTADVRTTTASAGYAGASGGGNVFLAAAASKNFIISGINTLNKSNLQLSFGIYKSTTTANGSDLELKVSSDGINYSPLTFTSLPLGSGSATWHYRAATGTIPSTANLYIQWVNNNTGTNQYRLDDIRLTFTEPAMQILSFSPDSGAAGDTVILQGYGFSLVNAVSLSGMNCNYSIVNDSAMKFIVPFNAVTGAVVAQTASCNSDTTNYSFTVMNQGVMLNVSLLLEGFYQGGGTMSTGDTVEVELYEPLSPNQLVSHATGFISSAGTGTFFFPEALSGNSYYISIRHRNSLTTWSKYPVLFTQPSVSVDFITP